VLHALDVVVEGMTLRLPLCIAMHTLHHEGSRRIDPDQCRRLQSHLMAGARVCAQKPCRNPFHRLEKAKSFNRQRSIASKRQATASLGEIADTAQWRNKNLARAVTHSR
jgi:hypothetical protein